MPTGSQTVAGTVTQSGSDWLTTTQANLATKNSAYAKWDVTKLTQGEIRGTNHSAALPSNAVINSVALEITYNDNGSTMVHPNPGVELALTVDGTTALTSWTNLNFAGTGDLTTTVTFSGLTIPASQYNAASFGYLVRRNSEVATADRWVDFVGLTPTYVLLATAGEEEESMDHFAAGTAGGLKPLLVEAVPTISSSAAIFANAPDGTIMVEFEFRDQAVSIKWNGGTATTSAGGGTKYGTDTVFRRTITKARATAARAIQMAATATGTITYWGREA